jgi:hypothetical protein
MLDKSWDQLGRSRKYKGLQEELTKYGFTPQDWANLQKAERVKIGSNNFLFPDGIKDPALSDLYRTFIVDTSDTAIITPGAKEKAIMNLGFKPGTIEGMAARMFWQFKSFPLTLWTRVFSGMMKRGQVAGRGGSGFAKNLANNIGPITTTAFAMTVFGGLAMSIKDVTRGREPRLNAVVKEVKKGDVDKMDWRIVRQGLALAAVQGGSLGLLGDIVWGLDSQYGGASGAQMFGPVPGKVVELGALGLENVNAMIDDKKEISATKNIWAGKNLLPFQNYFATRAMLDLYGTYAFLEMANPGYLAKMERKYRQKYRTDYIEWGPFDDPTDVYYK